MARILVTGMSGTGKSAALRELAGRGHRTVDTDTDEWSRWDGADWIWREDAMSELLATRPAERAEILDYLDTVEPLLRATATLEIDASAPLAEVVGRLLVLAEPDPAE